MQHEVMHMYQFFNILLWQLKTDLQLYARGSRSGDFFHLS